MTIPSNEGKHRGPGPKDHQLFAAEWLPELKTAAAHLCWLLDRGYTSKASLKLVGDRYKLRERQRKALGRCCASDSLTRDILSRQIATEKALKDQTVIIDGFNILITIEAALSGAPIFRGRDGVWRDLSGVHGSYHKIEETPLALFIVNHFLSARQVNQIIWILDKPVSNSGRLATLIQNSAGNGNPHSLVELSKSADQRIASVPGIVLSSDSHILARCRKWFNLVEAVKSEITGLWPIDLH